MKAIIIWTLSFLLGFEPALFAAGKNSNAEIKAFLENSQITQKPISLKELYAKNSKYLPESLRADLQTVLSKHGDYVLPKFDVNKISGPNGEELYQLQAVQDGKSVSMTIVLGEEVFMKVNGTKFTWAEMNDVRQVMAKVGVPEGEIAANFPTRKTASAGRSSGGFLSAEQIMKLPLEQRKQYFKQLRDLLESMEAVENSFRASEKKTSSLESDKFRVIAQLLLGEAAWSAGGDIGQDCIAAGWPTNIGNNKYRTGGPGLTCGADSRNDKNGDGIDDRLQQNCSKREFQCNPDLYGNHVCVAAGPTSTKACNDKVKGGNDIPDGVGDKESFNNLKDLAEKKAQELKGICTAKASGYKAQPLTKDQRATCQALDERIAVIEKWNCDNSDFKATSAGKIVCALEKVAVVPPISPEPAPQPQPASGPQPAPVVELKTPQCDKLPNNFSLTARTCEKGTVGSGTCYNGDKAQQAYQCTCDNSGQIIGPMKCDGGKGSNSASADDESGGKKKKKEGPNWLLIGGIAFGGMFLLHYLTKSAYSNAYGQINPTQIPPPITVPPLPTTLPPPIPINPVAPRSAQ